MLAQREATFKLREAIRSVRTARVQPGEVERAMRRVGIEHQPGQAAPPEVTAAVFSERWSSLSDAMASLAAEAFEAEVLWGARVQVVLEPLYSCIAQLRGALQVYFMSLSTDQSFWQSREERMSTLAMVFSTDDPETDDLYAQILDAIAAIQQFLKPYINSDSRSVPRGPIAKLRRFFRRKTEETSSTTNENGAEHK